MWLTLLLEALSWRKLLVDRLSIWKRRGSSTEAVAAVGLWPRSVPADPSPDGTRCGRSAGHIPGMTGHSPEHLRG